MSLHSTNVKITMGAYKLLDELFLTRILEKLIIQQQHNNNKKKNEVLEVQTNMKRKSHKRVGKGPISLFHSKRVARDILGECAIARTAPSRCSSMFRAPSMTKSNP